MNTIQSRSYQIGQKMFSNLLQIHKCIYYITVKLQRSRRMDVGFYMQRMEQQYRLCARQWKYSQIKCLCILQSIGINGTREMFIFYGSSSLVL